MITRETKRRAPPDNRRDVKNVARAVAANSRDSCYSRYCTGSSGERTHAYARNRSRKTRELYTPRIVRLTYIFPGENRFGRGNRTRASDAAVSRARYRRDSCSERRRVFRVPLDNRTQKKTLHGSLTFFAVELWMEKRLVFFYTRVGTKYFTTGRLIPSSLNSTLRYNRNSIYH